MGSRVRENAKMLFDLFCEIKKCEGSNPIIVRKYPENYDGTDLKQIPKFAFPCEMDDQHIQYFSFVLTSMDSTYTFGYCRYDPKSKTALVTLSAMPWYDIFYRFLNCIGQLSRSEDKSQLSAFLSACYKRPPLPGHTVTVTYNDGNHVFQCEYPGNSLPSIPENVNITNFFSALDAKCMIGLFAALLNERRIAVVATKPSRLSAIVQTANDILYPMSWQHIFITVLPTHLVDYLLAPMPFLIGVPREVMNKVKLAEVGEIVLVDGDSSELSSPFDDLETLPNEVVNGLRRAINDKNALGDTVSRAFRKALIHLIGGYKDAISIEKQRQITFNQEDFLSTRKNMEPFLSKILQSQIFQQFIEERLDQLNSGRGITDDFVDECNAFDERGPEARMSQQYKEWARAMKREGGAILKTVKEKANPAMKSAVNSFRQGGRNMKSAVKGLKKKMPKSPGRLSTTDDTKSTSSSADSVGSQSSARSVPVSPTSQRSERTGSAQAKSQWSSRFSIPEENQLKNGAMDVDKQFEDLINFSTQSRSSCTLPPRLPERPPLPPRYPIVSTRNLIDLSEAPRPPPRTGQICGRSQFYSQVTKNDKVPVSRARPVQFKQVDNKNGAERKPALWRAVSSVPSKTHVKGTLSAPPAVPGRPSPQVTVKPPPVLTPAEAPQIECILMDIDPSSPGLKSLLDSFDPLRIQDQPQQSHQRPERSIWSPVESTTSTFEGGDAWSGKTNTVELPSDSWIPRPVSRNQNVPNTDSGDGWQARNSNPMFKTSVGKGNTPSYESTLSQLTGKTKEDDSQAWLSVMSQPPKNGEQKIPNRPGSTTDKELLKEYGIDFEKFEVINPPNDNDESPHNPHNEMF